MPGVAIVQKVLGVDTSRVDTVQLCELGTELDFADGTRRKYIRAGAAIVVGDALKVDFAEGVYDYDPTSAVDQPLAGVSPLIIADNSFGWVIVRGKATAKVAAAIVAGAPLSPSAVAGTLDDIAAAVANALAAGSGIGCIAIVDDVPAAGFATVVLT